MQSALTKTGAALSTTGNTFSETLGLVTAGSEILVGQSGKVGRGLRSISINMANAAKEADRFEGANGKVNVALKDEQGNLRSTFDIMRDLAEGTEEGSVAWDKLNNAEKTAIGSVLAGKTQFETFSSILSNYSSAVEAAAAAENSQGSAQRENERFLDSIQGKLQAFQSAWEQLSFHVVSSNFLTEIIEFGTKAIEVLDDLARLFGGPLTAALGGAAWIGIPKVFTSIFDTVKEVGVKDAFKVFNDDLDGAMSKIAGIGKQADEALPSLEKIGKGNWAKSLSSGLKSLAQTPLFQVAAIAGFAAVVEKLKKELSFEGEVEDVIEINSNLSDVQSQIEALRAKGDELTSAEQTRLNLLESQKKVLEQQLEISKREASKAFNKEAEARQSSGKAGDVSTSADEYLNSIKRQQKIEAEIEATNKNYTLSLEERNALNEKNNKLLEREAEIQAETSEEVVKQREELSNINYYSLGEAGRAEYDKINIASLAVLNNNAEILEIAKRTIETYGSAKFNSWGLDISSFKTGEELLAAIEEHVEDPKDIKFIAEGLDEVKKQKEEASKDAEAEIKYSDDGTLDTINTKANDAAKPRTGIIDFQQTGLSAITSAAETAASKIQAAIGKHASGKPKGAQGGLSWLGDEGDSQNPKPEMVVSQDGTAELVGTQGWELRNLKSSDIVYSYAETKKLLGGKNSFSGIFPRYASGKNQKKIESLRDKYDDAVDTLDFQQEYNKLSQATYVKKLKSVYNSYTKKLKAYNSKLTTDQIRNYKLAIKEPKVDAAEERIDSLIGAIGYSGNLSKALKKINSSQKNKLISADDAKKLRAEAHKQNIDYIAEEVRAGRKSYSDLQKAAKKYWNIVGKDSEEYYESLELLNNVRAETAKETIDDLTAVISYNGKLDKAINKINNAEKKKLITVKEAKELRAEAYREEMEYLTNTYEATGTLYSKLLNTAKKYWKEVGKGSEEYYESLDILRESEVAKIERIRERREDEVNYAEQYIRLQISELERQQDINKSVQEEADARVELAKAQNTYVKVYREGVGWTYEKDAEAIKNASDALNDLNASKEADPIQYQIDKYNEILDLFDKYAEEADFIELQNKLGVSGIKGIISGSILDKDFMSEWLQTQNTRLNSYDALITKFEDMSAQDYEKYVNTGIDMAMRNAAYKDYAYTSGALYSTATANAIELAKAQQNYLNAGIVAGTTLTASQVKNAGVNNFNFDNLVLPNVSDAATFLDELKSLTNGALQNATKR